jgi:hypothetical protein
MSWRRVGVISAFIPSSFPWCCSNQPFVQASGDFDYTHHAATLVLQDMAVEHPLAGIVGDERDLDRFVHAEERRVLERSVGLVPSVSADVPVGVAVLMLRVLEGGAVNLLDVMAAASCFG